MSTTTRTDQRELEALLHERWCHVLGHGNEPLCGSAKQAKLSAVHRGRIDAEYCSGCGLRNCPDCALAYREGRRCA